MSFLKLRQFYNVNGNKMRLVMICFTKLPHKEKGITEYIFRTKTGKTLTTSVRSDIKSIKK